MESGQAGWSRADLICTAWHAGTMRCSGGKESCTVLMPGARACSVMCYFHCHVRSKAGGDSFHESVTHGHGKCQSHSKEVGACWALEPLPSSCRGSDGTEVKEINGNSNTSDLLDNGRRTVEDFCTKLYLVVSWCDLGWHCA